MNRILIILFLLFSSPAFSGHQINNDSSPENHIKHVDTYHFELHENNKDFEIELRLNSDATFTLRILNTSITEGSHYEELMFACGKWESRSNFIYLFSEISPISCGDIPGYSAGALSTIGTSKRASKKYDELTEREGERYELNHLKIEHCLQIKRRRKIPFSFDYDGTPLNWKQWKRNPLVKVKSKSLFQ